MPRIFKLPFKHYDDILICWKDCCYSGAVRLTPNVALRGTATQSETHAHDAWASSPFIASYANDGNFDTSVTEASGPCTFAEPRPPIWWQVELQEVYEITKVAITGRKENRNYVFNYHYIIFFIFVYQMESDKIVHVIVTKTINKTLPRDPGAGG